MAPPRIRLVGVVLDSPRPVRLAQFYAALLRGRAVEHDDTWVTLEPLDGGIAHLSFQLEPAYARPVWPASPGRQQMSMHLDLLVDDLAQATARAVSLGGELAAYQPQVDVRVILDPDGHPFCLFEN